MKLYNGHWQFRDRLYYLSSARTNTMYMTVSFLKVQPCDQSMKVLNTQARCVLFPLDYQGLCAIRMQRFS